MVFFVSMVILIKLDPFLDLLFSNNKNKNTSIMYSDLNNRSLEIFIIIVYLHYSKEMI